MRPGPLSGLRVVEIASIGPGPHCAMLLADLGADVLRVERAGGTGWNNPVVDRGRAVLTLDLKGDQDRDRCLTIMDKADVLIEGFRPGVMERLGLGPKVALERNPHLIYGRMTGWGQDGWLAQCAGHDINYIALSGALGAIRDKDGDPVPPLNLVGDFGGGSLFLAFGIMAALWERAHSGRGQVVDAAIVDGVASMMTMFTGLLPSGGISLDRGANLLGGDAPHYRCYRCADGKHVAIGPLEPQFLAELLSRLELPAHLGGLALSPLRWGELADILGQTFLRRNRDEWCALLERTDGCFAPVLSVDEAMKHPHALSRQSFVSIDGIGHAVPAPRFSRTPGAIAGSFDPASMIASWD